MDDLESYDGAEAILDQINQDGYEIVSIYKRQNGIININCCDGEFNTNVKVLLENGKLEELPVAEGCFYEWGIIKPALIPEIATY